MLDIHAFDVDRKLAVDADFLNEMKANGRHHHDITSHSFAFEQPFDIEKFEKFVQRLSDKEKVYRSKGFVSLKGQERRAIFHGVNNRFHIFWDRAWKSDEVRGSQLVFIGKKLDATAIERGLRACLAA